MNILAIDLGTKTGFAYNRGDDFQAGTWHLMSAKEVTMQAKVRLDRRKDARVRRLCDLISALGTFDVVIYEDVEFQSYRKQTQLWAALRSSIWLCADATLFECVNVKTLKLFATGRGDADKGAMAVALLGLHTDIFQTSFDDNAIDACWLHIWARKNLQRLNNPPTLPKS